MLLATNISYFSQRLLKIENKISHKFDHEKVTVTHKKPCDFVEYKNEMLFLGVRNTPFSTYKISSNDLLSVQISRWNIDTENNENGDLKSKLL